MISIDDHHLVLTMEESAEAIRELTAKELADVIQRCSKQLRFGRDEVQPGQSFTNGERLRDELLDVLCCVRFLERSGQIEVIDAADVDAHMIGKQAKIDRMLALSRDQGRLEVAICSVQEGGGRRRRCKLAPGHQGSCYFGDDDC